MLPERALDGDPLARRRLVDDVYRPLAAAGGDLLDTVTAYLDQGGSLEGAARALFVHPNTVRYRLRRIAEVSGFAPTDPRGAYALRIACGLRPAAPIWRKPPNSRPEVCSRRHPDRRPGVGTLGGCSSSSRPARAPRRPASSPPGSSCPRFEERLRWLSACAGLDLVRYGTEADADEIRDTAVAQPLLVGAGLVSLLTLFPHPSDAFQVVGAGAGHSVGEITAAAAAGVISAEQAMVLVRERGRAMAAAAAVTPTGMSAILGGDPDEVLAAIERHGLTAANHNGAGQVVAGGTLEQLAALAADAPAKTRVIPLQVAGAFHTHHMAPAVDGARLVRARRLDARPADPAAVEPRRRRGAAGPRGARTHRRPGRAAGALGPRACRPWPTSASPR